jgi:hypothetical protein
MVMKILSADPLPVSGGYTAKQHCSLSNAF